MDRAGKRAVSESGLRHTLGSAGRFRSWGATHCGTVRDHNEDGFVNRPDLGLWSVADGAGGHQSGEIASKMVVDALETCPQDLSAADLLNEVRSRIEGAHAALRAEGNRRGNGAVLATTVVAVMARDDHFACLWAGDSRIYLLRGGQLAQISRDHSLVQEMVDSGALSPEDAINHPHANVITRAVGADIEPLELEKRSGELLQGDRLMLCSDGLCKTLDDAALAVIMAADEDAIAERLVLAALAAKATDNVTAVVIEVVS